MRTAAAFERGAAWAAAADASDPLGPFRARFEFPRGPDGADAVYLVGNSLGLMPTDARRLVLRELDDWARLGVEGHFHAANPWFPAHEPLRGPLARLVGAGEREVVAMNSLTVNLHLLMLSFYRPTRERFKILIENDAFPSDAYAVQSQARFHAAHHGFDPDAAIVRLVPREGEATLRTADILDAIDRHAPDAALLLLGGVNYLTGQWFEMGPITGAARARGLAVGWDLAHAAGNVPLRLHDWGVDFAAWCSYKYLNAGPGAVAGAFVHERHLTPDASATLPRLAGWWGNDPATRFRMGPRFVPVASADAWAMSNPPILALAPLRASLEIFDRAGMEALRARSLRLTGYLEFLLEQGVDDAGPPPAARGVRILTPPDPAQRGCQLSLDLGPRARGVHERLSRSGVVCDFREPGVIRAAPTPLYTRFEDVRRFAVVLDGAVRA